MRLLITILLYGVAFVPMLVARNAEMGVTAGKVIGFRVLVEGAVLVWALCILLRKEMFSFKRAWEVITHPLSLALIAFTISMAISAAFSVNPGRAFWGTIERGEGVFGMVHYVILFLFIAWGLSEKERGIILKIFLLSGLVIFISGIQETLQGGEVRTMSYVGNASFLAGHFLFLIAAGGMVAKESKKYGIWWHIGAWLMPLVGVAGIFFTRTRSAIAGIAVGGAVLLFLWAVRTYGKKVLWIAVAISILGAGGVWVGKSYVRGLMGSRISSVETRVYMWDSAWQAFKEKPIVGWGGEHFLLASSVHYNPKAARHGETWFDRTHNKILDILVSQGIIGILAFFALVGSVIWIAWRDKTGKKAIAFAFGAAYLTHSIFTPDQTISWIDLIVFLGWLAGSEGEKNKEKPRQGLAERAGAAGIVMFAIAALWYGNGAPYRDLKAFYKAKRGEDPISFLEKGIAGNTFVRAEAEGRVLDFYMEKHPDFIVEEDTSDFIQEEARFLAEKEPQDIRHGIRYAQILLQQGKNNNALYDEAEQELEKLLQIAPKRLELYYLLAQTRGLKGRMKEAVQTAEYAVELAPEIARAHFILGVVLALSEDAVLQKRGEEELIRAEELDPALDALMGTDLRMLVQIYELQGRRDRIADIALRNANGVISRTTFDEPVFLKGLLYFAEKREKNPFIKIAAYIAEKFPEQKETASQAIELAEQEKWDIIQNMFEIE